MATYNFNFNKCFRRKLVSFLNSNKWQPEIKSKTTNQNLKSAKHPATTIRSADYKADLQLHSA